MVGWLVRSCVHNTKIVLVAAAVLIGLGVWRVPQAEVDVLPEFAPVTVQVQTEALGLSAQEVEDLITSPMEQDLLNGVAWLAHIHSESVPGLSSIELTFEPGTDPLKARQVVQERMTQAFALPNVSQPPLMMQPVSSSGRVAMIGISSKTLTPMEIGVLARWTIRPKLIGIPGVANVAVWGQRERQVQVQVQPEQLRAKGVTLEQVIHTTGNALLVSPLSFLEASTPGTGGFIDTANQRLGVQHMMPIRDAAALARVVVEEAAGALQLGDVASVVEGPQPLIGQANVATGDGFILVVEKVPGANTLEVAEAVEDALATLAPGLKGLEVDTTVFRPATYVETAMANLRSAGLMGAALAVVALGALLLSWRRVVVAVVAITMSYLTATLLLSLAGVTLSVLVWAGLLLAVAVVVNDAVEASAATLRDPDAVEDPAQRASFAALVVGATIRSSRAMTYGTVTVLVVLVPMFVLGDLAGASFYPRAAVAAAAALLVSALVSLTITPVLCVLLLHKSTEPALARWWQRKHARRLQPMLRRPMPLFAVGLLGVAAVAVAAVPTQLDKKLLPDLREPHVLVRWDGPPGTALPEMTRIGARVSDELRGVPGVVNVGSHFGRAVTSDQAVGANAGMVWASISPEADYDRTVEAIEDVVAGYPGLDRQLITYSNQRVDSIATSDAAPVTVRVYGEDLTVLQQKAEEVRAAIADVEGVQAGRVSSAPAEPTILVEVDLAKAKNHGVKPGDVRRAATTLLAGIQVGSIFDNNKVFDVVVWSRPEARQNLTDVRNLLIDTPADGHVRLGDVADVKVAATPNTITHDGVSRRVDVTAQVSGRDLDAVLADVRNRLQGVDFPLEYHAEVLQDVSQQRADQRAAALVGAFAALGVFLLLQSAFGSWRLALVGLLALPLSLSGGLLVAWLGGGVLTLSSVLGLVGVVALAVRAMIALFLALERLRGEGALTGAELVGRATRERVLPTMATVVTTVLALLPLLVLGPRAGLEVLRPLAGVLVGGLLSTALVALFLLPALFLRFAPTRPARTPHDAGPSATADALTPGA
ncbi:efflux RND transporter permease subunit [Terrabacter sp. BE26]|uniref:efflux RND transporter permease subunit n=1 Tax=Terrabacter sp. BE26 TaxID=2898152 RepID=UPI0035BE9F64